MSQITIQLPQSQIEQLQATMGKQAAGRAIYNAVKRATDAGRTAVDKEVRDATTMSKKYSQRAVKSRIVGEGAGATGIIRISGQSVPLIGFRVRASKRNGVTATLTKDRAPLKFRHAFIARVSNTTSGKRGGDHEGVWFRSTTVKAPSKKTKRGFAGRLQIEEAKGPTVLNLIGEERQTAMGERVLARTQEIFQKRLLSQIDRHLASPKAVISE